MEIIIQPDPQAASRLAARIVAGQIRAKPDSVLGLATGGTPVMMYNELRTLHESEGLDCSRLHSFNLDEYVGLPKEHPASYYRFMWENLFEHIGMPADQVHVPDGMAEDIPAHCAAYEQAIVEAGGLDLQVLGIGTDGHIGFNEPSSSLASRTRIKTLTQQTRKDNAPSFEKGEAVPMHCITMGIGTIMEARQCLLLAFGKRKADIVARMVEGAVSARVPASMLQMHPHTVVLLDEESASSLEMADYYRWIYDNKPDWQRV